MSRVLLLLAAMLVPAFAPAQSAHPNVLVSTVNMPNETAIIINPKNTQEMVAGANINNQYRSLDGGQTWAWRSLSSPYSVWGDPVVAVDTTGAFYYFHLTNMGSGSLAFPFIDRLVVQRATSASQPFSYRSFFAYNPPKQQDKEWVAVDRRTNVLHASWTEFDVYGSSARHDSTRILYTRSADQGLTWSPAQRLSTRGGDAVDEDATVEGAVPTVGPNGEVYVAWAGHERIVYNRSLDGGLTWLPRERLVAPQPGGWVVNVPGVNRCNGLPVTACDVSRGPHRGTVYVNWVDQRNGPSDTDVWLARSTDGGLTWSPPARVNDDPAGSHQFFTWMTVDQVTGHLWFVFYDRRNYPAGSLSTDVYGARSTDGGLTFQNFRLSQAPFTPSSSVFMGDYTNIAAHNNVVRPVWTRMDNRQTSVWTAIINPTVLSVAPGRATLPALSLHTYPNPASHTLNVALNLPAAAPVTLSLLDGLGRRVQTPAPTRFLAAGAHQLSLPVQDLSPGVYTLEVRTQDERRYRRVLIRH